MEAQEREGRRPKIVGKKRTTWRTTQLVCRLIEKLDRAPKTVT